MTNRIPITALASSWRQELQEAITRPDDLLELLALTRADVGLSDAACADFPMKVPLDFARRMERGNPTDPLLIQVLPQVRETQSFPGYSHDPVGELGATNPQPGIVHKYRGRVLLIVTGGCAVNCRYCFRRHFPYADNRNSRTEWRSTLDYIRANSSITEVILSGGDPLIAGSDHLAALVDEIAAIDHVARLRVHSRLPVVLPNRVTSDLLAALTRDSLQTVMVIHSNHANEIDDGVTAAITALASAGITILNQAVLLAGVNDTLAAQLALCEQLFAAGVLPYYLHLLDRVQGAAHFEVSETAARALHQQMRGNLPGYLLPRLVREVEGADAKIGVQT